MGFRYKKEVNGETHNYIFDGWSITAETNKDGELKSREVRGYGLVKKEIDNNQYYYHQNEHGDITHLTNIDEEIENSYQYDVFGNIREQQENVENVFKYAGEQQDQETQQYYLRARFYNLVIARFTQEDVYRSDGLNLYVYVVNNPLLWFDPSGYAKCPHSNVPESNETNYILFNKTHKDSLPKPKGVGYNGGNLQSHHGLQQGWASHNLSSYGYNTRLAPTVTIETGTGLPHTLITNAQNTRRDARENSGRGKWSSTLQEELGYIVSDFQNAGFSRATIDKVLEQQYSMLDKLNVPYTRIVY